MNEDKLQDEIISVSVIEHDCKGGCSKGQVKSTPEFLATTEKEALDSENFMIVLPSYVFDLPFSVYTVCSYLLLICATYQALKVARHLLRIQTKFSGT